MLTVKLTNGMQSVNTCYTTIKNVILVKSKRFLVIIRKPLQLLMLYSNVKLKIKNQRFLNYQNQIVLFNFKIVPVLKSIQETIDPRKNCFRTMVTLTDFFPRSMLRMFYKAVSSNKSNFESCFRGGGFLHIVCSIENTRCVLNKFDYDKNSNI